MHRAETVPRIRQSEHSIFKIQILVNPSPLRMGMLLLLTCFAIAADPNSKCICEQQNEAIEAANKVTVMTCA